MSSSAFTFTQSTNIYNDLITANLIAEGATGVVGYFSPYYLITGSISADVLYNKYTYGLDTISETNLYFNLAESFYQSITMLPSRHVIVGDPKTSIVLGDFTDISEHGRISAFKAFPNPASTQLSIEYSITENTQVSIKLYSLLGTKVYQHIESVTFGKQHHNIDVSTLLKGLYIVELEANGHSTREKIMIN